jgi:hypothetical protein
MGNKIKDVDAKYLALQEKLPMEVDLDEKKTFSKDELRRVLPPTFSSNVTNATVGMVNKLIRGSDVEDNYKENFVYYANVMSDPRFRLSQYMLAIQYVSFRALGYSISRAWQAVFPDKVKALLARGATNSTIHNHAKSFNNTVLVTKILAQAMVPTWILNQHHYQDAINRQVWLMHNAKSENVQTQAAKCLVDALTRPEVAEIEITHNVGTNQDSAIEVYKREAKKLAQAQLEAIKNGVTLEVIAESKLEPEEVNDD